MSPWRDDVQWTGDGTGRAESVVRGREGGRRKGRGGESGDADGYLKVVGIISTSECTAGDQLAYKLFLGVFPTLGDFT